MSETSIIERRHSRTLTTGRGARPIHIEGRRFLEDSAVVPPKKRKATVERSVYFFRADSGSRLGKPIPLDLEPVLQQITGMPFEVSSGRYWDQPSGDTIALWTDESSSPQWDRFALATVRRTGLPRSELGGRLRAVPLARGAGLHEPIHIVVFDNNILGVEYNFYGPRPSRLSEYLSHATQGASRRFELEPLLRRDMAAQLERQRELRFIDLQIRASYASKLAEAEPSLGRALKAAAEASEAEVVGLVLRPEPRGRQPLARRVLNFSKTLASRDDLQENATKFVVKGVNAETGLTDELNLLEDKLVSRKRMISVGGNSRAIKQSSAFKAIEDAYRELRVDLEFAASISIKR